MEKYLYHICDAGDWTERYGESSHVNCPHAISTKHIPLCYRDEIVEVLAKQKPNQQLVIVSVDYEAAEKQFIKKKLMSRTDPEYQGPLAKTHIVGINELKTQSDGSYITPDYAKH